MFSKGLILFVAILQIHLGYGEKLVILKGFSSQNKVEVFDFDNLKESTLLADYPAEENGRGQAWLTDDNSRILSCGGSFTNFHKDCKNPPCYSYSLKENSWSELKNQPKTQINSGIFTSVPNEGPIILGGYKDGKVVKDGCLDYSTTNSSIYTKEKKWKNGPTTPIEFYYGCSANVNEEKTYVAVNGQAYMINWKTMNFKTVKPIQESPGLSQRMFMACIYDPNSKKVIIAGGKLFNGGFQIPTNSVKLYNPSSDSYENGPDLPNTVIGAGISLVGNEIILSGGRIGLKYTESADLLKYSKKGWTKLPVSMRHARSFHNVITLP